MAAIVVRSGLSPRGEGFIILDWNHANGTAQMTHEEALELAAAITAETFAARYDAHLFAELADLLAHENLGQDSDERAEMSAALTTEMRRRRTGSVVVVQFKEESMT